MEHWEFEGLADLEKLGDKVQDIIETAVNSKNYQKMNQSITQAVNHTIRQYQDAIYGTRGESTRTSRRKGKSVSGQAGGTYRTSRVQAPGQKTFQPQVYSPLTGEHVKNILFTVFGGILTGGMTIGLLTVAVLQMVMGVSSGSPMLFMLAGTAVGGGLLAHGCSGLCRLGRFRKYVKALGSHTYCGLEQLARAAGKPVKYVKKDIRYMILRGWFLEGHMDRQETCLITSNETFRQYEETQKQLELKKAQEIQKASQKKKVSPEVQEVLDKGNEYLEKIRRSNDAIPGEEISAKISRMEQIVQQIFIRAEEHPEIIPDLKRLMNYYLPMTVKLLNAYEDMDKQPVQGENIKSSKKEIEETLDTLNEAFGKLLDSVFQDTAWDVSSDISVLHTVLAQEGLTDNDFTKQKQQRAAD